MKSVVLFLRKNIDVIIGVLVVIGGVFFFGIPLLSSFGIITYEMPLNQPVENVVAVRLLDTSEDELSVLDELETSEIINFYTDLCRIRVHATAFDRVRGYGERSIQICYRDGSYEILGEVRIHAFSASGEFLPKNHPYFMPSDDLSQLIDKYFK